jgi:hypothetical protein
LTRLAHQRMSHELFYPYIAWRPDAKPHLAPQDPKGTAVIHHGALESGSSGGRLTRRCSGLASLAAELHIVRQP